MAVTANLIGHGLVHQIDAVADTAAVIKYRGSGGTPSAALADSYKQKTSATAGEGAVTVTVNKTGIVLWHDIGSGNELDYSGGGTNEGEMVYIWAQFLAAGILADRSDTTDGGFGIALGTSTTNYSLFSFFGGDTTAEYSGGWTRLIIDPTKPDTATKGTGLNAASVRYFGVFANVGTTTARFDNLILDRIDSISGIQLEGSSTADDLIGDVLTLEETDANQWGIFRALNTAKTAIEINGAVELGDNTGTVATTFSDIGSAMFAAAPLYWDGTAGSLANSVPDNFFKINCVGNGTGATSITIGAAVGSDSGRSGWTLVGNDAYTFNIDFDDGNVNTNLWYGCSFQNLTGALSWGSNTAHKLFSSTFAGCGQFDPVGGVQLRNINFVGLADDGTADASNNAALLWNSAIDIQKSNFLANSHATSDVAHGIEHATIISVASGTCSSTGTGTQLLDTGASFSSTVAVNDYAYNETDGSFAKVTVVVSNTELTTEALAGGTDDTWQNTDAYSISPAVGYTDLLFSGNEKDVLNSAGSGDALFVSKSGTSDPSTSTNVVEFIGSVTLDVTVVDASANPIENAEVAIYLDSDLSELLIATTNASGVVTTGSFTGSTPSAATVKVRKSSAADTPRYINKSQPVTIASSTGLDVTISLTEDTIA